MSVVFLARNFVVFRSCRKDVALSASKPFGGRHELQYVSFRSSRFKKAFQ